MNSESFARMAYGDLDGLRQLAGDFFEDTRLHLSNWAELLEQRKFLELREHLHRCKGGACLFGLERLVAMIGAAESPKVLENRGFDLIVFEKELSAAEHAVMAMAD